MTALGRMATDPEYSGASDVPYEVLELLGKKYTLQILDAMKDEVRSARELVNDLDVPRTTVYRRLESLEQHDLVVQREVFDLPGGAHHYAFESNLRELRVEENGDGYDVSIDRRDT